MDNLSHSVVGLAVGELLDRSLPSEAGAPAQRLRRRLLLLAAWAASNLPDLDIVLAPLLPAPLGYLLHHRGHTHTLLMLLPQALLVLAVIWALWPGARALLRSSAAARGGLAAALCIGLLLHGLMDYLNSYGIHPFHPFSSSWLYGDMVFIVEPVFWVGFGVPLLLMLKRRRLKGILLAVLAGVLIFFGLAGFLHPLSLAGLAVLAALVGACQSRAGATGHHGLAGALAQTLAFIGVQSLASGQAERSLTGYLHRLDPASAVLDTSLTAFPSNPLCWIFVSVERNLDTASYRLRRGSLSVAPAWLPVQACPAALLAGASVAGAGATIALQTEHTASLNSLRRLAAGNCHFHAWLRFARTPVLLPDSATDLRFGADPSANFTTLSLAGQRRAPCPGAVPQWDMPRADLLAPSPDIPPDNRVRSLAD